MSVDRKIREGPIGVELRRESFAGRLEMLEVFLRPPIGKPALGVKLAALIVKTVTDLMADNSSNRTVVVRSIGIRIEKRRLKNRGRKIQCVLHGEIYGVHRLRSHPPL